MSESVPANVQQLRAMFEGGDTSTHATQSTENEAFITKPSLKPKPALLSKAADRAGADSAKLSGDKPSDPRQGIQASEADTPIHAQSSVLSTEALSESDSQENATNAQSTGNERASSLPLESIQAPMSNMSLSDDKMQHDHVILPEPHSPSLEKSPANEDPASTEVTDANASQSTNRTPINVNVSEKKCKPQLPPRPPKPHAEKSVASSSSYVARRPAPARPATKHSLHARTPSAADAEGTQATAMRAAPPSSSQVPSRYDICFDSICTDSSSPIARSGTVYEVWMRSGLPQDELAAIWRVVAGSDPTIEGLSRTQFTTGLRTIDSYLRRDYILSSTASGPSPASAAPVLPARS